MANGIRNVRFIEPTVEGLCYLAIIETEGDWEAMDRFAFTEDRQLYTFTYRSQRGAPPSVDTWDTGIVFTGKSSRNIDYEVVDENGVALYPHEDRPVVRDGM